MKRWPKGMKEKSLQPGIVYPARFLFRLDEEIKNFTDVWIEGWTIKKAERRRTDAFELWYWRRLSPP